MASTAGKRQRRPTEKASGSSRSGSLAVASQHDAADPVTREMIQAAAAAATSQNLTNRQAVELIIVPDGRVPEGWVRRNMVKVMDRVKKQVQKRRKTGAAAAPLAGGTVEETAVLLPATKAHGSSNPSSDDEDDSDSDGGGMGALLQAGRAGRDYLVAQDGVAFYEAYNEAWTHPLVGEDGTSRVEIAKNLEDLIESTLGRTVHVNQMMINRAQAARRSAGTQGGERGPDSAWAAGKIKSLTTPAGRRPRGRPRKGAALLVSLSTYIYIYLLSLTVCLPVYCWWRRRRRCRWWLCISQQQRRRGC